MVLHVLFELKGLDFLLICVCVLYVPVQLRGECRQGLFSNTQTVCSSKRRTFSSSRNNNFLCVPCVIHEQGGSKFRCWVQLSELDDVNLPRARIVRVKNIQRADSLFSEKGVKTWWMKHFQTALDLFFQLPNVVGVILAALQLVLFYLYPSKESSSPQVAPGLSS